MRKAEPLRPLHRKTTSQVDLNYKTAILVKDFSQISHFSRHNTYSIDIKPKWSGTFRLQKGVTLPGRAEHCRYCKQQFLKGRKRHDAHNIYCPELLFSDEIDTVKMALSALLRNPLNQLRVFRNNQLMNSSQLAQEAELIDILAYIFMTDPLIKQMKSAELQLVKSVMENETLLDDLMEHECCKEIEKSVALFLLSYLSDSKTDFKLDSLSVFLKLFSLMSLRDSSLIIQIDTGMVELPQSGWQFLSVPSGVSCGYHVNIIDLDMKSGEKLARFIKDLKEFG